MSITQIKEDKAVWFLVIFLLALLVSGASNGGMLAYKNLEFMTEATMQAQLQEAKASNDLLFPLLFYAYKAFRYLFYLLPFIGFMLVKQPIQQLKDVLWPVFAQKERLSQRQQFYRHFLLLIFGMLLYSAIVLLLRQDAYIRFVKEAYFYGAAILSAYFFYCLADPKKYHWYIKILFWGIVLTSFLSTCFGFTNFLARIDSIKDIFIDSRMPTEHYTSFLYGILCFYFLNKKDWQYAVWAFLLTLITYKRIAILGLVITSILWFVIPWLQGLMKRKKLVLSLLTLANFAFVGIVLLLVSRYFEEDIFRIAGSSTQQLSTGRMKTYDLVLANLSWLNPWGVGIGKSAQLLADSQHYLDHLHSDVLKLMIEIGLIGFVIWIWQFYKPFIHWPKLLVFPIYMNILFLTDNTLAHVEVLFVFYVIAAISIAVNESTSSTKSQDSG